MVTRLRKVLLTEGVQIRAAFGFVASSLQGFIWAGCLLQSGAMFGFAVGRSQYVCGPKVAYCGATIMATE